MKQLTPYQILNIVKGFLILGMSISYYMAHKKQKRNSKKAIDK